MNASDDAVRCPKCHSSQVHAEKRGWRATTGFFGSSKVFITCLKCGHRFKPGGGYKEFDEEGRTRTVGFVLAIVLLLLVCLSLLKRCG